MSVTRARQGLNQFAPVGTRDRVVDSTTVVCPDHGTPVGERCRTSTGSIKVCPSRRRMALRLERESQQIGYSSADVDYARRQLPETRRKARVATGMTRKALAELLSIPDQSILRYERGQSIPGGPMGATYGKWLRETLEPTRALAIESDPTLSPTGRMVVGIVEHIRTGLAECGAPFTAEQEAVMGELEAQVRTWSA